jgi:hypothetical protein
MRLDLEFEDDDYSSSSIDYLILIVIPLYEFQRNFCVSLFSSSNLCLCALVVKIKRCYSLGNYLLKGRMSA